MVVEKLHEVWLLGGLGPKAQFLNLSDQLDGALLSQRGLGHDFLLLGGMLATRKRPFRRMLIASGCSALETARSTHSSLFSEDIDDIPIDDFDI